jgi:hypothetical protein
MVPIVPRSAIVVPALAAVAIVRLLALPAG